MFDSYCTLLVSICFYFFIFLFLFCLRLSISFFFFFNDTATTEIYTLSLHDALPICIASGHKHGASEPVTGFGAFDSARQDRKSTRLNSSHLVISYAVFCLKKKKKKNR